MLSVRGAGPGISQPGANGNLGWRATGGRGFWSVGSRWDHSGDRDQPSSLPRTVPQATRALAVGSTSATVSCVNATATQTCATQRRGPARSANTTPPGNSASCVRLATTETPRLGHRRTASPAPALSPTRRTCSPAPVRAWGLVGIAAQPANLATQASTVSNVPQVTWVTPTCGGAGACHKQLQPHWWSRYIQLTA